MTARTQHPAPLSTEGIQIKAWRSTHVWDASEKTKIVQAIISPLYGTLRLKEIYRMARWCNAGGSSDTGKPDGSQHDMTRLLYAGLNCITVSNVNETPARGSSQLWSHHQWTEGHGSVEIILKAKMTPPWPWIKPISGKILSGAGKRQSLYQTRRKKRGLSNCLYELWAGLQSNKKLKWDIKCNFAKKERKEHKLWTSGS